MGGRNKMQKIAEYKEIIYKMADEKDNEKGDAELGLGELMAIGGTTALSYNSKPLKENLNKGNITGRHTLYHNTNTVNVDSILQHGIKGSYAADPNNLTNRVLKNTSVEKKKILNKVYLDKSEAGANDVGRARQGTNITLKAHVPVWKLKTTDNPELRGAKNIDELAKKLRIEKPLKSSKVIKDDAEFLFNELGSKQVVTLEGDLNSKYLLKSPHYAKAGIREVSDFIIHHPDRFIKSVGPTAASVGAIAAGGGLIAHAIKRKKSKP